MLDGAGSNWKQTALTVFAVVDGLALGVAKILCLFLNWGALTLTIWMQAFCGLSMMGMIIAMLSSVYQVYKDFKAMPEGASLSSVEMLSIVRLELTIGASAFG